MITQLVEYARDGNLDEFRKLLYREPELINETLESGESPLIAALYNGKMEIVDYLLEKGIAVTIHEAAALGDEQTIAYLLDYEGGLIHEYSYDGWTPLHLAAFFGALEAVQLLLDRGADIHAISKNHLLNTPLHAATAAKRTGVVHLLLQKGADVSSRQKKGQTVLHMAVDHFDIQMVRMLLDFDADPLATDDSGVSPLQLAESKQYQEIVDLCKRRMNRNLAGEIRYHHNFYMPELNDFRTIRVYLPPDYELHAERRYPVLYMHDGQNLFDVETASYGMIWDVAHTMETLIADGTLANGMIVVGIDNNRQGHGRFNEYSPWTSEIVKPLLGDRVDPNERIGGDGFAYLEFIVQTLKPYIDRHYRTQSGKADTWIGGSSMGGYISLAAGFAYPDVFGRILACSTAVFFEEQALFDFIHSAELSEPHEQKIYMDIGTNETSNAERDEFPQLYLDSNRRLYELLKSKGFVDGESLHFVVEDGGEHNELAWARRLPDALRWLT